MPSFDTVSKIDMQELDNALNQAKKEIATRYDFQGTETTIELAPDKRTLLLKADSAGRLDAARDVLFNKLAKRGVSLRGLELGKVEPAGLDRVKQTLTLTQGIPVEKAKKLAAAIKESKLKVTSTIQGDALRVTGKQRDDLQQAMALLRTQQEALGIDLQFNNVRV
jgi:uncharacterized protein YajQ (UPF0234 family)